ncbi:DUF927 domain-containing protein [Peribacillus frigoritolerans]|uniref:DUF927 domain-containing protein n=1 Tax=Peribacillus frigoritolerans TaxID=450367 RepID=UPI0025A1F053|nr:DUF927 domain-containing protein [Peribacillus frigoritolerans]MDM5304288.1 DUF927 domain-containing protein [Peribacillus frigoritolerans]
MGEKILQEKWIIPYPYFIRENELFRIESKNVKGKVEEVESKVSRNAPVITKMLKHIEKNEVHYEMNWVNKGDFYTETVAAGVLASKKELLKMADKGLSCNDSNSKYLVDYFDSLIGQNEIPKVEMTDRIGFIENRFIHPTIAKNIKVIPKDGGEHQLLQSFNTKGTVEGWINNVFNLIKDQPKAVFPILASFASVILHEADLKPIVVDVSGTSSTGKSGLLQMCASVWAEPKKYIGTFFTTLVAVERRSTFLNSFPLILDDSNGANDPKFIQPMIYQYVNNTGKQRGSLNGSQHTNSWQSLMITSGENEIVTYANAQGVPARVILITNFSFENEDKDFFGKVYNSVNENYGAIGVEFLKRWQDNRKLYMKYLEEYEKQFLGICSENAILKRLSRHYAFIVFTGRVLSELFLKEGLEVDIRALEEMFIEMAKSNKAADMPMLELQNALEDIDANRSKLYSDFEPYGSINAFYHNGDFYLAPAYLKERLGVNEKQIRYLWMKRGLTGTFNNRGIEVDYKVIKKNKKSFRAVLVKKEIVEQLGFDFS